VIALSLLRASLAIVVERLAIFLGSVLNKMALQVVLCEAPVLIATNVWEFDSRS